MLGHLTDAFSLFFQFQVIVAIGAGTILGIIMGAMPGLTSTMAIAILLPLTYGMSPIMGFGMLLGAYCGGTAGGSVSATLLKIPGTPSSVATTFDAYPMAQKGEAGKALGTSIFASFVGGIFSAAVLSLLAPPIARFALRFGAAEYFSLAIFGLTIIASVSQGSLIRGIIAGLIGILVASVGTDPITGITRFTYGQPALLSGISLLPALIGLFAVSQAMQDAENIFKTNQTFVQEKIKGAFPRISEVIENWRILLTSALIGGTVGAIPGAGGSIASFVAYDQAKRMSKTPEKFGKGCIEGVIASETSNNAMTGGALIPMMTLGVPGEAACAVLMGGLLIQGLRPGPLLFRDQPAIAYGIFMALFAANIFMFLFQFYGIKFFVKILKVPREYLSPIILMFCVIGAYGVGNKIFDVYLLIGFGILGYFLSKYNFGTAPVVLGMILGGIAESNFRRGMILFRGDWTVFFTRPISLLFLILSLISLLIPLIRKKRDNKKGLV
ncbi:tripartite tricarboxylate transporter permease [Halocella sp. SP3-1]|uniref:tripartite tricarboxylate transporter permease n=1 Tax=Halocella sp. SP3-1 TaxID=2382161 RepID=UPI000F74DF24|nr:tripartite tricarboxylate transporter permease [Halocella sp. SP3-1]AZO93920.1 C4-dicarboxylate ABC transporter permease [Halocella sp. SP3-1]